MGFRKHSNPNAPLLRGGYLLPLIPSTSFSQGQIPCRKMDDTMLSVIGFVALRTAPQTKASSPKPVQHGAWWYWMGLNHRPVAYKATALPIELQHHIDGDKVPNLPPVRQDPLKLDGACCGRCIQIFSNLYRSLFSILLLGRLLFLFRVHVQTSGLQSFNAASRIVILQPIA